MAEEVNINTEASKLLSSSLAGHRLVKNNLQLIRSYAHILEYLSAALHDNHYLVTGSFVEATQIPGSDVDHMQIFTNTRASDSTGQGVNEECHVLIIDTHDSRHGFAKLRISTLLNTKDRARRILEGCVVCGEDESDYISSYRFSADFLELVSGTNKYSAFGQSTTSIFRHGPCATVELEHSKQSDIAVGIECIDWPRDAEEWCTRPRTHDWPTKEAVSELRKLPCYLLPVGDEYSEARELEWRFAFVPTERELIWSFSDTQIQCYVILKLLKKQVLEPIAPDQLSSFFLKTIMFWEIENNGPNVWTPENLIQCIVSCLKSLRECVMSKTLPHYVFRKRNLLHTKFSNQDLQKAVVEKIEDIEKKPVPYVLQAAMGFAPLNDLCSIWISCQGRLSPFIHTARAQIPDMPKVYKTMDELSRYLKANEVFMYILYVPATLDNLVEAGLYLKEHESEFDSLLRKYALSCLKLELGKRLIPEILNPNTLSPKQELIPTTTNLFRDATIGFTTGFLHIATLHYLLKEYTRAKMITDRIISEKANLLFIGRSAGKITLKQGKRIDVFPLTEATFANDIYFTSEDVSWAPPGISMECALLGKVYNWNFCLLHPLAYAYYLLFMICLKRKHVKECKQFLEEFSDFLRFDGGKHDRHRSVNLLGFCYYKLGNYTEALNCFERSIQITGPLGNAASYHICIVIMDLLNDRKRQGVKEDIIYTRTGS